MNAIDLSPFITSAMAGLLFFKYPLIALGALIEGPIVMVACGFLLHFNIFSLALVFISLVIGDLIGDIIWYYIGEKFANPFINRFGRYFGLSPENFVRAKELFHRYHLKILIISKLTLGFGMAIVTLMAAGATKVSFKTYFILNFIGEFVLVSVLLLLGYFFGELYKYIADSFKIGFILFVLILLSALIVNFTMYAKRQILKL